MKICHASLIHSLLTKSVTSKTQTFICFRLTIIFVSFTLLILRKYTMYNHNENLNTQRYNSRNETVENKNTNLNQLSDKSIVTQNFIVIWLDGNIAHDEEEDCVNTITKLKNKVNKLVTFSNIQECISFIGTMKDEQVFFITSGTLGQKVVPIIHEKPLIHSIYVFCQNDVLHKQWAEKWSKIKGVYRHVTLICKDLKHLMHKIDQSLLSMNFITDNQMNTRPDQNKFNLLFMYNQTIKEIILSTDYDENSFHNFITYCRQIFTTHRIETQKLDKFEHNYRQSHPIWWYTYPSFLCSMFNRSLRTMKLDLIIRMGFFIHDLHNNIAQLHAKQCARHDNLESFIVYRGQSLPPTDFSTLMKMQGGVLAFNSFLLTNKNYQTPLNSIQDSIRTSNHIGILCVMCINPSTSPIPFASIRDVGYFKQEDEILFTMNSIFRIGQIQQTNNNRIWRVDLTLISYSDPILKDLNEKIHRDTFPELKGWDRLGTFLIKFQQFNKAQLVYDTLITETKNDMEKANIYHMLGWVKDGQGNYEDALNYYRRSIQIKESLITPPFSDLAASYENAGVVYEKMADYSSSLKFHLKALQIRAKNLPPNHLDLAKSYENVGLIQGQMGNYSEALSVHQKALEIYQQALPPNHSDLGISYNNIGLLYDQMGQYSASISSYQKALEIYQNSFPLNHPHMATTYNNIGLVHSKLGDYAKAFEAHKRALEIRKNCLPPTHPDLATSYNNIGMLYQRRNEFSNALEFYQRALETAKSSLPPNHHDILLYQKNISLVKSKV